ncbi:hypothetical protein V6N13_058062 [Hibiscus sabdariffa]
MDREVIDSSSFISLLKLFSESNSALRSSSFLPVYWNRSSKGESNPGLAHLDSCLYFQRVRNVALYSSTLGVGFTIFKKAAVSSGFTGLVWPIGHGVAVEENPEKAKFAML